MGLAVAAGAARGMTAQWRCTPSFVALAEALASLDSLEWRAAEPRVQRLAARIAWIAPPPVAHTPAQFYRHRLRQASVGTGYLLTNRNPQEER